MPGDYKLPIEGNRDLLADYGLAFAWINAIEGLLEIVVYIRKQYTKEDWKSLDRKTLGQKLKLAHNFLEKGLFEKLDLLNDKRVLLAHSGIAEELNLTNPNKKTGKFIIEHKEVRIYLDKKFTDEVIGIAKDIAKKLHGELAKDVKFERL